MPAAQGTGPHVYVGANPGQWIGRSQVGDGECVALVEQATGAPRDKDWREGALVQGNSQVAAGTAIAVFDSDGRYGNHKDGTSHAAIYLRQDARASMSSISGIFVRMARSNDGKLPTNA